LFIKFLAQKVAVFNKFPKLVVGQVEFSAGFLARANRLVAL